MDETRGAVWWNAPTSRGVRSAPAVLCTIPADQDIWPEAVSGMPQKGMSEGRTAIPVAGDTLRAVGPSPSSVDRVLSDVLLVAVEAFVGLRAEIAQRRMQPASIVEALNVVEHIRARFVTSAV